MKMLNCRYQKVDKKLTKKEEKNKNNKMKKKNNSYRVVIEFYFKFQKLSSKKNGDIQIRQEFLCNIIPTKILFKIWLTGNACIKWPKRKASR